MDSLKQYISLFDENRETIELGSAPALNALRAEARSVLEGSRLPDRRTEGYEKTDINDLFAPDYGINIGRIKLPVDIAQTFRCDVPNISTLMGIVANDAFAPTDTLLRNLPEGVKVMSLVAAAREMPELVGKYYGRAARIADPATALNTMLAQDGVFIHLGRGVRLEKPIQVVNVFSSATPLMAFRRVLVVAEEDSKANILFCDHSRNDGVAYLSSQVAEIFLAPNSSVDYYEIEESSADTRRMSQLYVRQESGSQLRTNTSTLLNGLTRNEFSVDIRGHHASCGLYGMAIGSKSQHIDNSSSVVHAAPHTSSNQLFKYVLDDRASGAFEGSINVTSEATFTEAYQSNNNILASADARMHTKPQLLIYNDDVKCSHGATTGQLNNEALFYMQTRGIPLAEARTMLMQAFMINVVDTVAVESLRDRLRHLVEKRFDGTLSCPTCRGC